MAKILLASLFSSQYPSIGETHALSVLSASLIAEGVSESDIYIFDMVAEGQELYDALIEQIANISPATLGLSVGYGTFSILKKILPKIRMVAPHTLIVCGGAVATYLAEVIVRTVDTEIVVVKGEGETAFSKIIKLQTSSFGGDSIRDSIASVDGVVYYSDGNVIETNRGLEDLSSANPPFRGHLSPYVRRDIQLFSELSRGCSWSSCSFCLRGLLDIDGNRNEYRRFSSDRTLYDLHNLEAIGASSITFADEDFLGESLQHARHVLGVLSRWKESAGRIMCFDISASPHSIWNPRMSSSEFEERLFILKEMKNIGLRKVFIGIESGCDSQLRRYKKQHRSADAINVINILREIGVDVEIGWILLDPLMSLPEVEKNLNFLIESNSSRDVSYVFNRIRIQCDSKYLKHVRDFEKLTGRCVLYGDLDMDTLSYGYNFIDNDVSLFSRQIVHVENLFKRPHYILKNIVRFGRSGVAGQFVEDARNALSSVREELVVEGLKLAGAIRGGKLDQLWVDCAESKSREISKKFYERSRCIANAMLISHQNPLAERLLMEINKEV